MNPLPLSPSDAPRLWPLNNAAWLPSWRTVTPLTARIPPGITIESQAQKTAFDPGGLPAERWCRKGPSTKLLLQVAPVDFDVHFRFSQASPEGIHQRRHGDFLPPAP